MFYTAFQAHAYLHHIGLYSAKPDELANFYKTALNMKKVKDMKGLIILLLILILEPHVQLSESVIFL